MQSIKSTPMGMIFVNTVGETYVGWCGDTWHGHGDVADMHSVFRYYHWWNPHGMWIFFLHAQCCCSDITRLELTICMPRKQCVSSVVMMKHTWHTWFFLLTWITRLYWWEWRYHMIFFLQNRLLEEYV